jgi:nucleoside-diphosphate-sugar epimerase
MARDVRGDGLDAVFAGCDAVVHLAWALQPSHDVQALHETNVEGSRHVMEAVARAEVPAFVYASSVGAYAPGPDEKRQRVGEDWPATGVAASTYSRQKAEVERMVDAFARDRPQTRVVQLRKALVFKREAASEISRLFLGPLGVFARFADPRFIPAFPHEPRLCFQVVHSDDAGDAYLRAVTSDVRGAFNIATEPVIGADELRDLLDARPVGLPPAAARVAGAALWQARLVAAEPLMHTTRARTELGWAPRHDAVDTVRELLAGFRARAGTATPPLEPRPGGEHIRLDAAAAGSLPG